MSSKSKGGKTYKSNYQGESGIYKASKKTSGQTYKGKDKDKKKAQLYFLENILDFFGFDKGGMARKKTGHMDYRKGGMVINTVDNRKNK